MRFKLAPSPGKSRRTSSGSSEEMSICFVSREDHMAPVSLDRQLLMLQKAEEQKSYPPVLGKTKRPNIDRDYTMEVTAAKHFRTNDYHHPSDNATSQLDRGVLEYIKIHLKHQLDLEKTKTVAVTLGTQLAESLQNAVQAKLLELKWIVIPDDYMFADYVVMWLVNGKTQFEIETELFEYMIVGGPHTQYFARWLFTQVELLKAEAIKSTTKQTATIPKSDKPNAQVIAPHLWTKHAAPNRPDHGLPPHILSRIAVSNIPRKADDQDSLPDYEDSDEGAPPPWIAARKERTTQKSPWLPDDYPIINPYDPEAVTHDNAITGRAKRARLERERNEARAMTETSGSAADVSSLSYSDEGTLDDSPNNPLASVEVVPFYGHSNFRNVRRWAQNAGRDVGQPSAALNPIFAAEKRAGAEAERLLAEPSGEERRVTEDYHGSEAERRRRYLHELEATPQQRSESGLFVSDWSDAPPRHTCTDSPPFGQQSPTLHSHFGEIHEVVEHGMDILTSKFEPPERTPSDFYAPSPTVITISSDDDLLFGIQASTYRDGSADGQEFTKERTESSSPGGYRYRSHQDIAEERPHLSMQTPDYHHRGVSEEYIPTSTQPAVHREHPQRGAAIILDAREEYIPNSRQPAIHREHGRSGANIILDARLHRLTTATQQVKSHLFAPLQHPRIGAGPNLLGGRVRATYPEPPALLRKRKTSDDEERLVLSLRREKRARLEKEEARTNFPIHQDAGPNVPSYGSPRFTTVNLGDIKENIQEDMDPRRIDRWFAHNERRRNPSMTLARGVLEPGEVVEEEIGRTIRGPPRREEGRRGGPLPR